jgi:NAD kinase
VSFEKIVVVTRRTRLEGLVERFNSRGQAKFVIEHGGGNFRDYEVEHDTYHRALETVARAMELGPKVQVMDRSFVPTYLFSGEDVVVTVGQDGLVANTAKYVGAQPIVAVNPDPARFDGVLLPFGVEEVGAAVRAVLGGSAKERRITLAETRLNDGQRLVAFNDFFVGASSHVSARYRIRYQDRSEQHSSSGVLVSTGAGSTGWLSSVFNMATGVARFSGRDGVAPVRLGWDEPRLLFVVREPFASRHSQAGLVAGVIERGASLEIESLMPSGGVVFSDGVEQDFLAFNSGAVATIGTAAQAARLVVH